MLKKLRKKLYQSDSIINREKFLNTAVLIPLYLKNSEYYLLFEKRSSKISQPGEICFPGGKFDPAKDKNPCETAIRETIEELGICRNQINSAGKLGTLITRMGAAVDVFIAELNIESADTLKINKKEVEKLISVPVKYFLENNPLEYPLRVEVHPYYFEESGKKIITFPSEELGLPGKYHNPWIVKNERTLVYKFENTVIWGITAELIFAFIKLFGEC